MPKKGSVQKLRIFVASPSDVASERAKVATIAESFKPLADSLGIVVDVLDWRAVVPNMGRPEQVILDQLQPSEWDVFMGILWHRFGTPPLGKDPETQKNYLSGTEEEFKTAHRLWKHSKKPRIMIYRCTRAIPQEALDPDQFKLVKEFFAQFDAVKGDHPGLYQSFDSPESFERLLHDNLQRLLLEYGEQIQGKPIAPEVVQIYAPKIPFSLPRRPSFFGRDREKEGVSRALSPDDRTWGVLLDGIGGIGKSALAIEVAWICKEKGLFDAFIFVSAKQNILDPQGIRELKPIARTLDEFLNETARVLGQPGIPKLASDEKRRALLDVLRTMRTLLIYDNLETLTKEEQEAMADFLRELPQGCKSIITSRRRGGEGAVWLRLEKLEWDAARKVIAEEARKDGSLAEKLLRVSETELQELYDETKGSPLRLVHVLGLMRTRKTLTFDGALKMLRGNRDPDLDKFIFQEARKELTVNDQSALRALSFFVPSATFEAWMKVAELSRNALETTIDRLSALSLVDVMAGEDRYALHPLTRNFVGSELLVNKQIATETGIRFALYWADYAKQYGGESKESYKTYDRLEAEWTNLDAAANWLWETVSIQGDSVGDKDAARLLNELENALWDFCRMGSAWDEIICLSERAYKTTRVLEDWRGASRCAKRVAFMHFQRGRTIDASLWADRCAEVSTLGGSKFDEAESIRMCGLVAEQREDYAEAERLYREALALKRNLELDSSVRILLSDLGNLAFLRNDYDSAQQYYLEAMEMARKDETKEGQASCNGGLGNIALHREQLVGARNWFEQELALAKEVGVQGFIAEAKSGLARVHEAEGRVDLALPLAQEALKIYERLQHRNLAGGRELVERLEKKVKGQK